MATICKAIPSSKKKTGNKYISVTQGRQKSTLAISNTILSNVIAITMARTPQARRTNSLSVEINRFGLVDCRRGRGRRLRFPPLPIDGVAVARFRRFQTIPPVLTLRKVGQPEQKKKNR